MGEVWALAWPTLLTMASYTVMQFLDSLMVAQVGAIEVAAQGNGGVWSFTPMAFLFGLVMLVNSYVAQAEGAGRPMEVARYGWAGLWLSVLSWLVVLLPIAIVLPLVFTGMHHEPRLVELESEYARILLVGGVVTVASRALGGFFFGLHRPGVVAVSALAGNAVNLLLNYALIYGESGLPALGLPGIPGIPAMGLRGAAIGTVGGTFVELLVPLVLFLSAPLDARYHIRGRWRFDGRAVRDLLRSGWPNGVSSGNELLCWALFMSWLVGKFGTLHLTAGWITLRFMHVSFMPAFGFATATTSLVGRYVGAGDPDTAGHRARLAVGMALVYMTCCGIVLGVFRHQLIGIFTFGAGTDPEEAATIVRIGGWMMLCAAVFQTFDAVGIVYSGALRGAGDTAFPGIASIVLSWTCVVGLGYWLATRQPQLESIGPWIGASAYIILLGCVVGVRFERGRWKSMRLVERAAAS